MMSHPYREAAAELITPTYSWWDRLKCYFNHHHSVDVELTLSTDPEQPHDLIPIPDSLASALTLMKLSYVTMVACKRCRTLGARIHNFLFGMRVIWLGKHQLTHCTTCGRRGYFFMDRITTVRRCVACLEKIGYK